MTWGVDYFQHAFGLIPNLTSDELRDFLRLAGKHLSDQQFDVVRVRVQAALRNYAIAHVWAAGTDKSGPAELAKHLGQFERNASHLAESLTNSSDRVHDALRRVAFLRRHQLAELFGLDPIRWGSSSPGAGRDDFQEDVALERIAVALSVLAEIAGLGCKLERYRIGKMSKSRNVGNPAMAALFDEINACGSKSSPKRQGFLGMTAQDNTPVRTFRLYGQSFTLMRIMHRPNWNLSSPGSANA